MGQVVNMASVSGESGEESLNSEGEQLQHKPPTGIQLDY